MTHSTSIAFLGLGAMGERMALRLAAAGHELFVWNRSGAPASVAAVAKAVAASPREAAERAEFVITMVRDDEASRAVWLGDSGAREGLRSGALAVECSTLSPAWTKELAETLRASGHTFMEAPVVGSRPQADSGSLVFLAGGEAASVERWRPISGAMGNALHHLGNTPAGAYAKLIVNALLGIQAAALAELLALARAAQLGSNELIDTLSGLAVMSPAAKVAVSSMVARRFEPLFPVELAQKDLGYAAAAAAALGRSLPVTASVHDVFERASSSGLAQQNLTAVIELYP